jgi:hypothetical protein
MIAFPSLTIEGVTISRVICGTNALLGFSHVSAGRDAWIREHFTSQRIARVFAHCQELGINAVMGPLFPRLIAALDETAQLTGQPMVWVATTSMDRAPAAKMEAFVAARQAGRMDEAMAMCRESLTEQLAELKAAGAAFCLLHGAVGDRWPSADGQLVGCRAAMDEIRAAGLVPGSASHIAGRVVELDADEAGVAVLAAPVNKGGWHMNPSREEALALYAGLQRPLIAIKTLACGRCEAEGQVETWLRWAALAPGVQAIALGLMLEQEADQSVPVLRAAFEERFA